MIGRVLNYRIRTLIDTSLKFRIRSSVMSSSDFHVRHSIGGNVRSKTKSCFRVHRRIKNKI